MNSVIAKRAVNVASRVRPQFVSKRRLSTGQVVARLEMFSQNTKIIEKKTNMADLFKGVEKKSEQCMEAFTDFYTAFHPTRIIENNSHSNLYFA